MKTKYNWDNVSTEYKWVGVDIFGGVYAFTHYPDWCGWSGSFKMIKGFSKLISQVRTPCCYGIDSLEKRTDEYI